jgi:2-deoxystreptamine N-acetyl-D-glucosaminyltransferase/2-deoxystreptamine glucosyltransferase
VLGLGEAVARLHGLPLVVTVHTSVRHTLVASDARSRRVKRWGGALEGRAMDRATKVLTLTERLRALAVEGGAEPARVHVIPSGVRPGQWAARGADPFPRLRRPRVLFVGRLAFQKGVITLVEAASRMREDAEIVLVGDGPDRAAVERRAAELGLQHRVTLTGFVPHAQVPSVLRHGDVLVLPSTYEELGSVLVEGMRAGLPIVGSATGGIPEVVRDGETGVLCPPGDAAAFAAAIDGLLADPARRAAMGAAGRERARAYSWERLAPQVLAVYREALGLAQPAYTNGSSPSTSERRGASVSRALGSSSSSGSGQAMPTSGSR